MKKSYLAIITSMDGKNVGTVMIRGSIFKNSKWFYDYLVNELDDEVQIIDFKRVR